MIYGLTYKSSKGHVLKIMDGDRRKIEPVEDGFEWFNGGDFALHPDGLILRKNAMTCGARLDTTHLPKLIRWNGNQLYDYEYTWNSSIVSERFMSIVEALEPGLHQFEPVEVRRTDGSLVAKYFWFFPLVRLDCMDRERTTHTLVNDGRFWKSNSGAIFVVNLSQVGHHHVWIDPRTSQPAFVSETFKTAMEDAGITGAGYFPYETV